MGADAAFYTVTGRDFFPGAVALLNSLRLRGHEQPLHVLDCGLTARQRELLAPHANLIPAPREAPPSLLKLVAPQAHPAAVMVLLDADMIATRPLGELIEPAAAGDVVAFVNDVDRHFPEWGELLGLGTVRDGPYISSGALAIGAERAMELLPLVERGLAAIDRERTWLGSGTESEPFFYLDQDVLNAVLHSRLDRDRLHAIDARLAPIPPFPGVRLLDEAKLRCAYEDGNEPVLLHHASRKPWLVRMRSNVYSRLLTRLLLGADVALRLEPSDLPPRLRSGVGGAAARLATDTALAPAGLIRRLRGRPDPDPAWPIRQSQR